MSVFNIFHLLIDQMEMVAGKKRKKEKKKRKKKEIEKLNRDSSSFMMPRSS